MNRRTLLRQLGAVSGGIVATAGTAVGEVDDLSQLQPSDRVTIDGELVRVLESPADRSPRFVDATGAVLCCCSPDSDNDPCSKLCEEQDGCY